MCGLWSGSVYVQPQPLRRLPSVPPPVPPPCAPRPLLPQLIGSWFEGPPAALSALTSLKALYLGAWAAGVGWVLAPGCWLLPPACCRRGAGVSRRSHAVTPALSFLSDYNSFGVVENNAVVQEEFA